MQSDSKQPVWRRIGACLALLGLAGCGGDGSGASDSGALRFAVVTEQSGPFAPFGSQLKVGVEQAVKDLEASAEYDFDIEPKFYDCQSDQAICLSQTRDAVTSDEMPLVMGPIITSDVVPALEVTEKQEIPHLVFSTLPTVVEDYSNSYRWSAVSDVNNGTIIDFLDETLKPGETVAIVHANTEVGEGFAAQQTEGLKSIGVTPVADIGHDPSQADYTPVMVELKKKNPTYILLTESDPADVATMLRQARENGLKSQWIGADTTGAIELAGEDAIGYMVVSPWFPDNSSDPKSIELADKFRAGGVDDPGWVAAFAYDATMGIAKIAAEEGTSSEDFFSGLDSMSNFEGAAATWDFSKDRRGLTSSMIARWTGDGYETVYPAP